MFLGHFGAGLAAKAIDQKPSLGTYFMAAQFIDLIWPVFLIFGIERVSIDPGNTVVTPLNFIYYPFTHSLAGVLFWALTFSLVYYLIKHRKKAAILMAVLVFSHWVLDLLVHKPDLPIIGGSGPKLGIGAWNSLILTLVLEFSILGIGTYLYIKTTRNSTRKGLILLLSLVIFLIFVYTMNIFGPPPPDADAIGYIGLSQWLLVAWGYWIDKNREPASSVLNPASMESPG